MEKIMELYRELFDSVYFLKKEKIKETELSDFVAMRGNRYDDKIGKDNTVRFMVVGRAVNGWGNPLSLKSADTYAEQAAALFKRRDRFKTEWNMQDGETNPYSEYEIDDNGKKTIKKYYLSKSPFWSTTLGIYQELSSKENHKHTDWYEDIVWSNIYKIAPSKSGNPSTNLIYAQANICVKILREEIRLFQPTHMLLVVDKSWMSWELKGKVMFDFMEVFDNYEHCYFPLLDDTKNKQIVQSCFKAGECKVLVTCRPEGISQNEYKKTVLDVFETM